VAEADDLEAIVIPSSVKIAGGVLAGAGICVGITGLQAMLLGPTGWFRFVGPVALILSGGCVFSGAGVVRGRARPALYGLILGAVTALFAFSWVMVAFMHGIVSLISFAVLPLSIVATLLLSLGLKQIRRIDEARERLRAQGLDAGL
jgi:hypothetical protein